MSWFKAEQLCACACLTEIVFFCKVNANCYIIVTLSYMSVNCVSQSESSSAL